MNSLVDTHTFIWSLLDPERLGPQARPILEDGENRIWVSVITYWEISLKYALRKMTLTNLTPEQLPDLAAQMDFETLSLSAAEAATFHQLPRRDHKDPFDRLIIWQAIRNGLPLISRDSDFAEYRASGLKLIW